MTPSLDFAIDFQCVVIQNDGDKNISLKAFGHWQ